MKRSLRFKRIPGAFAISRLPGGSPVPAWSLQGAFFSVASTFDEVSIVCLAAQVPSETQHDGGWACFKLLGPFPFDLTGVLASFIQPLSDRGIPIFAISTFDTDYVLVKEDSVAAALIALKDSGHELVDETIS